MKRLKAFTLMELMVALVISGICINISYLSYEIIAKQYKYFKLQTDLILNLSQFNQILKFDVSESKQILLSENGFYAIKYNSSITRYSIETNCIVRTNQASIDTFKMNIDHFELIFKGKAQNEFKSLIDEIIINCIENEKTYQFHFYKHYSATDKIEFEKLTQFFNGRN